MRTDIRWQSWLSIILLLCHISKIFSFTKIILSLHLGYSLTALRQKKTGEQKFDFSKKKKSSVLKLHFEFLFVNYNWSTRILLLEDWGTTGI